jgi:hypothetical protein
MIDAEEGGDIFLKMSVDFQLTTRGCIPEDAAPQSWHWFAQGPRTFHEPASAVVSRLAVTGPPTHRKGIYDRKWLIETAAAFRPSALTRV